MSDNYLWENKRITMFSVGCLTMRATYIYYVNGYAVSVNLPEILSIEPEG